MAKPKAKVVTKTVIINGTKAWLTVLGILITYGGGSVWWAATQTTTLGEVKQAVVEIKTVVESKADIKALDELKTDLKDHMRKIR